MATKSKDFLYLHTRDLPYFRGLLRAVESRFYQGLDIPSPTLDVGCGDGNFAELTFDRKLEIGIDPWWPPIREAVDRNVYGMVSQVDGAFQPFPDAYFASAISNSVLEHIPPLDTPVPNLYSANMFQVYPQDRGQNYSVKLANRLASLIKW